MSQRPPEDHDARRRRAQARLLAHRGVATLGDRLVPLNEFRAAAAAAGTVLGAEARAAAVAAYLAAAGDPTPVEGPFRKVVACGGVYSNHLALAALLDRARELGADAVYCLGDLGGFGPRPDRVWPLLSAGGVRVVQGNYEQSLASGREDCNCGYSDPRDNHFAALSYGYTARHTSPSFKQWMGEQPPRRRIRLGDRQLLLVHGSPRRVNEFLFASTSPDAFLEVLLDQEGADGILCTHTGLQWHRRLPSGRQVANVGVIGRPANDGSTGVWFALLSAADSGFDLTLESLAYDHLALAAEMRAEGLPEEFVDTVLGGWWTTCLEILPPRERAASRF